MTEDWKPLDPAEAPAVPDPGDWFHALPSTLRIDLVMACVPTPPEGWSAADLADLAGCSETAIYLRPKKALRAMRIALARHGITDTNPQSAIRNPQ